MTDVSGNGHPEKLSPVETIKAGSEYLRGSIAEELRDSNDFVGKDSVQLLKHHGTYQQDDRGRRAEARVDGSAKAKFYSFMVRTAIPGGRISSDQLLAELDLCDEVGNTTLRITTRQGLQLHGVLKKNLKQAIRRINEVQLSTLAACGDVKRNVMCTPCPYNGDPVHEQMYALAGELVKQLNPRTRAYHQIWLSDSETGESIDVGEVGIPPLQAAGPTTPGDDPVEPIYGKTYLPRKFKLAIGLPGDNSVDVYANDIGLLAICENWNVVGYNVLVGGSFGVTPSAKKTFPAVAKPFCYIGADRVVDLCIAIVKVQRDYGNRSDRKVARMKYLIHDWGLARFRDKVEEYFGDTLAPPRPVPVQGFNDGMGWHEQGDGRWFYGLNVENGRIKDSSEMRLKSALREICTTLRPPLRLTPHQSIIFCDIKPEDRDRLIQILRRYHVPLTEDYSTVRRWAIACPALPTCGLAVSESERVMPEIIDQLEVELERLGLQDEVFTTRMTGCPNGCARPYNADIGLVGKTKDKYTIYLGGHVLGDRLNFIYEDLVPTDQVVPTLVPALRYFKEARQNGETFGDFCHRVGKDELWAKCNMELLSHFP
ncbi:MAG TPA: NADPH-dependent assimilatory sulfite reductase hemoprotein subunit [Lacipirellulaceae bacterium]|nr:NADPH-dependent assimilatory sulfite reductase hemoprotein subunit [Lacipirellulaceae bacterium]